MSEPATDYFTILGLPHTFDLDPDALQKNYFLVQRRFHPDKITGKTPEQRTMAIMKSADANKAYETLKSPLKRAWHLLSLHGFRQDSTSPSQELLHEILEIREELAESDAASLLSMESRNNSLRNAALQLLSDALAKEHWQEAVAYATRLSYMEKILEEVKGRKKALLVTLKKAPLS